MSVTLMNKKNRKRLFELIKEKSLIISEDENFKLASGGSSNFFFDMKTISLNPEGANLIAEALINIIMDENIDYIGGLETGAIPIIAAVCTKSWLMGNPILGFFVRKESKKRGTMKLIEGNLKKSSRVLLVDDVTTRGTSVLKAVDVVRSLGCIVEIVVTIVDRLNGAKENLAKSNVKLIPLFTKEDFEI